MTGLWWYWWYSAPGSDAEVKFWNQKRKQTETAVRKIRQPVITFSVVEVLYHIYLLTREL